MLKHFIERRTSKWPGGETSFVAENGDAGVTIAIGAIRSRYVPGVQVRQVYFHHFYNIYNRVQNTDEKKQSTRTIILL